MWTIRVSEEFVKQYKALPILIRKRIQRQEDLFQENPFHPSLHTEKLEPKKDQVWSIRVDRRYRILFQFQDSNTVIFVAVGPHDWIYTSAM